MNSKKMNVATMEEGAVALLEAIQIIPIDTLTGFSARPIGTGSFAHVYSARSTRLGKVAVKCLLPQLLKQRDELKLFFREALMLSKLDHE